MSVIDEIKHTFEVVTPDIAREWLTNLHPNQRPPTPTHVQRLASDMREGRFVLSPDAICITAAGKIANGQHRLRAVVMTGLPVLFIVARGWPDSSYDVMDAGLRRALKHRVTLDWLRTNVAIATVRQTVFGMSTNRRRSLTEREIVEFAAAHEAVFVSLLDMPRARTLRGSVLAACARALLNGANEARVARFIEVVATGVGDGEAESAAVRLFAALQSSAKVYGSTGSIQTYAKSLSALRAFLSGTAMSKIYAVDSDAFWPLLDGATEANR